MYRKENRTLEILLKVFLAVGIIAGICVIVKILYDKYREKLCSLCDYDTDCDFECLENDDLDCDCDNCKYASKDSVIEEVVATEVDPTPAEA